MEQTKHTPDCRMAFKCTACGADAPNTPSNRMNQGTELCDSCADTLFIDDYDVAL